MPSRSCETAETLRPARAGGSAARLSRDWWHRRLACARGSDPHHSRQACGNCPPRGFTLLELILVLALVALLAGVVVSGLGRSGLHQRREQTMLALHAELMRARVRAMRNAAPAELRVSWLDERSRIAVPSFDPSEQQALRIEHVAAPAASGEGDSNAPVRTRTVEALGMVAFDQQGQPFDSLAIAFNASGRTRARAWLFAVQRPGGAARAAAGSGAVPGGAIGGADTLFTISFDPVSGAPLLHGADESPDFAGSLSTDGSTAP